MVTIMGPIVDIAGSAGALTPLRRIVAALPCPCKGAIFIVMHIGPNRSVLPTLLNSAGLSPAVFAEDGAEIQAGQICVAPPDNHMFLDMATVRLNRGPKVHHTRPAADPLFISAAKAHGNRLLGIVLSGGDGDGAEGLRVIKQHGGTSLVQQPEDAAHASMPMTAFKVDHPISLPVGDIVQRVRSSASSRANR